MGRRKKIAAELVEKLPVLPKSEPRHGFFKSKRQGQKIALVAVGSFIILLICLILFLKLDTGAAAEFTDAVLRPVLGPRNVIAMEKFFYNGSDDLNRLTASAKQPVSPLTVNVGVVGNIPTPDLSLSRGTIITAANMPLPDEGHWKPVSLNSFPNQTVAVQTFVRPDPDRSFAYATLIEMDMSKLVLSSVGGTQEPGGKVGVHGAGKIPSEVRASGKLVAAFDGGFQYSDGQYGMIVGSQTYLPLQTKLATLVGYSDGRLKIMKYDGQALGSGVSFVRQNCPMLIENSLISFENEADKKLWGRTLTSDIYTWRSGVGLTANGNLLYAVGNSLTPLTLARALKSAGAVNAMQLDINPFWVRFSLFNGFANGVYTSDVLMKEMHNGASEFLNGYNKDFFYVSKKAG